MSTPNADNIIFNLSFFNNEPISQPAELYLSRDQAFVNNIENYYIRLLGATISTLAVPLFTLTPDMYVAINGEIELITTPPSTFTGGSNDVIYMQDFLNFMNVAYSKVHVRLALPGNSPIFVYRESRVALIIDQLYNPYQISIEYSQKVAAKFPTISTSVVSNNLFSINYTNTFGIKYPSLPGGVNYPCYYIQSLNTGYRSALEYLYILVTCNSIPVNKQQINNLSISTRTLGIIDVIPITLDDVTSNSEVAYIQQYPQYIDILSKGVLSEIDFKLYLVDRNYQLRSLNIFPGASVTCRYQFINKKLVQNYIN